MHKDFLVKCVKKHELLTLLSAIIVSASYWIFGYSKGSYSGILIISAVMGLWLVFSIGSNTKVLNNRFTKYLSGISMEVYLCHMMCFKAIEMLHLERYISQADLLYWLTCIMTLGVAITFSHIVKYKVLPIVEPYLFKIS